MAAPRRALLLLLGTCIAGVAIFPFVPGWTTTAACIDSDVVQCPLWAQRGDCDSNRAWMAHSCRKSCGGCAAPTAAAPASPAPPPQPAPAVPEQHAPTTAPPAGCADAAARAPLTRTEPTPKGWETAEDTTQVWARRARNELTDVEREAVTPRDLGGSGVWVVDAFEAPLAFPATEGCGQAVDIVSTIRSASFCFREVVLTVDTQPGSTLLENLVAPTDASWKEYLRVCHAVLAAALQQSQQACDRDSMHRLPATVGRLERQPLSELRVIELSPSREWTFQDSAVHGDAGFSCGWTKVVEGTIDKAIALTAPEESTVVDGGGHNGETLSLLAEAFQNRPKTHVHVFEPSVSTRAPPHCPCMH